jgi:hypothetical protein
VALAFLAFVILAVTDSPSCNGSDRRGLRAHGSVGHENPHWHSY